MGQRNVSGKSRADMLLALDRETGPRAQGSRSARQGRRGGPLPANAQPGLDPNAAAAIPRIVPASMQDGSPAGVPNLVQLTLRSFAPQTHPAGVYFGSPQPPSPTRPMAPRGQQPARGFDAA